MQYRVLQSILLVSLGSFAVTTLSYAETLDSQEWELLGLINTYRNSNGVPGTLQVSQHLYDSAKWMSNDMATLNFFSHTEPDGRTVSTRIAAFGYPYASTGENLGAFNNLLSAQSVFVNWRDACDADPNDPNQVCTYAHRANMLNPNFLVIGIGRAYSKTSTFGWYWTTDFGGIVDSPLLTQPTASGALQFVPLTPCRIMDTRGPTGIFGAPFIAAGATRNIPVPSSPCGVPVTNATYSFNITVIPRHGALGYLTVWPTGQPQPGVSTLNSPDGSILANEAIVPAGTGGSVSVFTTNDTDLVVDINGYFIPPAANTLQFFPLTPCRVLDTRNSNGTFGGPAIPGGGFRSFPIQQSGCNVPASAAAFSLNITVVPMGFLGYLTAWPTGHPQPTASTLNSLDGTVLANAAIVPGGFPNGSISLFASNTTNVLVDINGYFAAPAMGGLNFHPITPCRIVDTRNENSTLAGPILAGGSSRTFPISTNSCGVPDLAWVLSLNMTVQPSGPLGYLTSWPTGQVQPVASTLNAPKGLVVANAALVSAGSSGFIDVFVTNSTHLVIDANGYFLMENKF